MRIWRTLRSVAAAGAVIVLVALTAHGQALDRTQRPVARPAAPFAFPAAHSQTLENGLRIVVVEDHALPLVVVRVVLGVDSLSDPAGKEGLFALDTAMLREGTLTASPEQQADATATLGNAVSPLRFATVTTNFEPSLQLMADMLMHPAFPASALDRQKAALVAAQEAQRQASSTLARRILFMSLFGADHPLARGVLASAASVASISRDDLVRFHETFVRPNTTTLVVVGDVRVADVMARVRTTFGDWKRGSTAVPAVPPPTAAAPTTIYLMDRPGVQQSLIFVGTLGPDRTSRDFAALETMGPILGAAPASRLQQNLRERHSYMYSGTPAAVVWRRAPIPSMIYGSAPVATAKTDSALIEWIGELRGISERPATEQELALARGALIGTLPSQIETDAGIADRVTFLLQNGLALDYYDSYIKRISAVTAGDVRAAAKRAVDVRHLVIVVAGDRKAIGSALRAANIAPIVVVDDAGNRLPERP